MSAFDTGIYVEMYDQDEVNLSCNWLQNNSNLGLRFETDATDITVLKNSIVGNTINGLAVDDGIQQKSTQKTTGGATRPVRLHVHPATVSIPVT